MLTKKDLLLIKEIVDTSIDTRVPPLIRAAFDDFYDNIFEPHATQVLGELKEIKECLKNHDKRIAEVESEVFIKH